jgi:hypothetical protein
MQRTKLATGRYSGPDYFTLDLQENFLTSMKVNETRGAGRLAVSRNYLQG